LGSDTDRKLGSTYIDDDERQGLLVPTVMSHEDLDRFEQVNIQHARLFYSNNARAVEWLLSREGVKMVHRRMFEEVWAWAGTYRKTGKNIGVDPPRIPVELENLLLDTRFWIANNSYPPEELAVRFKHRLVFIHCFPNGNGRHARYMADLLISAAYELPMFSWGGDVLGIDPESRKRYISALRTADKGDIKPLLAFALS